MFDSKFMYREWTGGGHKIHCTNSIDETNHDLTLLLDKNAEDYLNDANKIETNNAYAKNLTRTKKKVEQNESGFDLDAILNPTEELDEIMKAFDFYEGSDEA